MKKHALDPFPWRDQRTQILRENRGQGVLGGSANAPPAGTTEHLEHKVRPLLEAECQFPETLEGEPVHQKGEPEYGHHVAPAAGIHRDGGRPGVPEQLEQGLLDALLLRNLVIAPEPDDGPESRGIHAGEFTSPASPALAGPGARPGRAPPDGPKYQAWFGPAKQGPGHGERTANQEPVVRKGQIVRQGPSTVLQPIVSK